MSFIFKAVFGIAGGVTLWFCGEAFRDLWIFLRLNQAAPAEVYKWSIQEISPSQFTIKASYRFMVEEGQWKGKTIFGKPYYLNRPSAEKALQKKSMEPSVVWYNLSHPKHHSLERYFPYKKCMYALVALSVLIYLFFLRQQALGAKTF